MNHASGIWGKAKEVPGTAALNTGGAAETYSVSCSPAGTCSAVGRCAGSCSCSKTFCFQAFAANRAKVTGTGPYGQECGGKWWALGGEWRGRGGALPRPYWRWFRP